MLLRGWKLIEYGNLVYHFGLTKDPRRAPDVSRSFNDSIFRNSCIARNESIVLNLCMSGDNGVIDYSCAPSDSSFISNPTTTFLVEAPDAFHIASV